MRYLDFREKLLRLDADAIDAARYLADEEDVLRSVSALEASLERLLDAIPARMR